MLLENKNVVVYGAGGAVGSAVARGFAHAGAGVFLTGRNPDIVNAVAKEISAAGGAVETAVVDARGEKSASDRASAMTGTVANLTGGIMVD